MATLAFNHEEITARGLKPALLELDGISRQTIEAHYKLYEGYVNKRNEIMEKLGEVDLAAANQAYSEVRALKVELSFALGGIKNHEIYFEHLGGSGGDPGGAIGALITRDFGSAGVWRADLKATGMAGRGCPSPGSWPSQSQLGEAGAVATSSAGPSLRWTRPMRITKS